MTKQLLSLAALGAFALGTTQAHAEDWYCETLDTAMDSFCIVGTNSLKRDVRAVGRHACKLGAGLVKAGVPLKEALETCKESFPIDDVQIRKLLDLGVFQKDQLINLPVLRATCLGSAANYAAQCLKKDK